tara:strand:- start:2932 stop:3654 length:723 start_codon:yes stop_codon:yes gene_type:complete
MTFEKVSTSTILSSTDFNSCGLTEAACNIGNWQWLSCTAFFAQFYRCYSPIAFPQKWDKNGDFIRRYVPELAKFDKKYIYEPWKAPIADQKQWGCRIGGERSDAKAIIYPKPMFDFPMRRDICLEGMKNAYHIGLYGNDPKVLDGTWRKLFKDNVEGPTEGIKGPPGAMVEQEDVDETEEHHAQAPLSPAKAKKEAVKSEKKAAGRSHKRNASQGTLDGMVKRTKKAKAEDVAPNMTHYG